MHFSKKTLKIPLNLTMNLQFVDILIPKYVHTESPRLKIARFRCKFNTIDKSLVCDSRGYYRVNLKKNRCNVTDDCELCM